MMRYLKTCFESGNLRAHVRRLHVFASEQQRDEWWLKRLPADPPFQVRGTALEKTAL